MKKFEFSLKKLLDFKQQILKKEKNELASLRVLEQEQTQQKQKLIAELEKKNTEFNCSKGFSPHQMAVHKNYMSLLDEKIKNVSFQIQQT